MTFTHMVYSMDGISRAEALASQRRLVALIRYKLKREYSEMFGFVRVWMSLAIVRSNSLIHRVPCDKGARIQQQPYDVWCGDGTDRALVTLNLGETEGMEGLRRGQGLVHGA